MAHIPGRDELALLDVDGAAGFAGGDQQVGLAAEEGGDLQDIDGSAATSQWPGSCTSVSTGRPVRWRSAEDARALLQAGAAETVDAGAVGLVVAGLEDVRDAEVGGDALDGVGQGARMGLGLNDAGAGDQEKLARADMYGADFKGVAHESDCKAKGRWFKSSPRNQIFQQLTKIWPLRQTPNNSQ